MRLLLPLALSIASVVCLPSPGMLVWNCRSCPNAMKRTFADVALSGPDGEVGKLVVTHMEPEEDVPSIQIENADTRKKFENMQKVTTFQVRIHEGTCESLGDMIHSVTCPGCQNSMGIKILETKKKLSLEGDGSEGDIIGNSIVFYDNTKNSKLACGTIELRPEA